LHRSASGLMDEAIPREQLQAIDAVLETYRRQGLEFHALRTRQAGRQAFISLHVLVPGDWTVQRGHDLLEQIEAGIRAVVPFSHLTTHLEPIEDPLSHSDMVLEREAERT
jgi:divalent metal cation (Fe/Co/Zn/Cd) transporter